MYQFSRAHQSMSTNYTSSIWFAFGTSISVQSSLSKQHEMFQVRISNLWTLPNSHHKFVFISAWSSSSTQYHLPLSSSSTQTSSHSPIIPKPTSHQNVLWRRSHGPEAHHPYTLAYAKYQLIHARSEATTRQRYPQHGLGQERLLGKETEIYGPNLPQWDPKGQGSRRVVDQHYVQDSCCLFGDSNKLRQSQLDTQSLCLSWLLSLEKWMTSSGVKIVFLWWGLMWVLSHKLCSREDNCTEHAHPDHFKFTIRGLCLWCDIDIVVAS